MSGGGKEGGSEGGANPTGRFRHPPSASPSGCHSVKRGGQHNPNNFMAQTGLKVGCDQGGMRWPHRAHATNGLAGGKAPVWRVDVHENKSHRQGLMPLPGMKCGARANDRGNFLGIIGSDPSVCKSTCLHDDTIWFFYINLRYIP